MNPKITKYRTLIKKALRANFSYTPALDIQILSLASALCTLEMANADIAKLTETTVLEQTRYGSKLAPHPAFKIQRDAQDSVTRQMKALGLRAADITDAGDSDPLVELTKKIAEADTHEIIRPNEE